MAAALSPLSLEEYLHTSYSPDVDFVDGEIQERHLGEFEHGRLQGLIASYSVQRETGYEVVTVVEQRIRVRPERVRICEVALLRQDAPREKVIATAPLLCIEILSPEDRIYRATRVLADYLALSVKNIWLIDPVRNEAFTFDNNGLHTQAESPLTIPGTSIELDLNPLFARLNA